MRWAKTLVDWQRGIVHCVLIQHLKKSLESFIQLISCCNSWILPVSSRIVSVSIFDQFSPRNCIACRALKSLQFFHLTETFLMRFTKIPILLPKNVHEEVVDLVEVLRLLDEHDKFLLFRDSIISFNYWITSSVIIGLELVFSNLYLTVTENLHLLSFQKILICSFSELRREFSLTFEICASNCSTTGLPGSMTGRQRLTGRQTFFMRVISSSTASWFFSLLGEQWWRERNEDGDVIVLEVIQGPVVAWGFLDVRFSGLRDVVVDGLITCDRVVLGKGAKVLISWSAQGICPSHRGRRSWWPERKNRTIGEKMDSKERKVEKSKRIKHTTWAHVNDTWDDVKCALRTPNLRLEPRMCVSLNVQTRENVTCEGVLFTPPVGCSRFLSAVIWGTLCKTGLSHDGQGRLTRTSFQSLSQTWRSRVSADGSTLRVPMRQAFDYRQDVWPLCGCGLTCKRSDYNKKNLAKCHFRAAWWRSRLTGRPVLYAALSRALR